MGHTQENTENNTPPTHPVPHNHALRNVALAGAAAIGGLILAPYVLPTLGIGSAEMALESIAALHGTGLGTGLAGFVNEGINALPLIGGELAKGGAAGALAVGVTGLGGKMLGNFIEKKQDGHEGVNWGKVIRYGALATSALLALPSVLTGLSVGIVYLSAALSGVELASSAITFLSATLGTMGAMNLPATGLTATAAALPHLLTCGATLLPAMFAFGDSEDKQTQAKFVSHIAQHKQQQEQLHLEITSKAGTQKLVEQHFTVMLKDADGRPLDAQDLKKVHTEKLHLFLVDKSLNDYRHIHPEPTGKPGEFGFSFTPATSNAYSMWADVTTERDGKNHLLNASLPAVSASVTRPVVVMGDVAQKGTVQAQWNTTEALQANRDNNISITVKDAAGKTVNDLEPVMGAYAHLVGFSADGKKLIHAHPMGKEPSTPHERGNGELQFHLRPETAGPVKFFLQLRRDGQEVMLPFGQRVKAPALATERLTQSSESYMHTSHGMA